MRPVPQPATLEKAETEAIEPSNWALVRRLTGLAWQHRMHCLKVVTYQVLMLLMTLSGVSMTGLGVDYIRHQLDWTTRQPQWWFGLAPPASWPPMVVISVYVAGGIILLVAARSRLTYLLKVATSELVQGKVIVKLRNEVYGKLQKLSFRFFDQNSDGTIINRVTTDVQSTAKFLSIVLLALFEVIIGLTLYLVFMLKIHIMLTLAVLATSPLLCLITVYYARLIRKEVKLWLTAKDQLVATLLENVQGVHVVKGFARQSEEIDKFNHHNEVVHDQQTRIFWLSSIFNPVATFLTQINTMVVFSFGGYLVVLHEMDATRGIALGGGLLVFATMATQFSTQIQRVAAMGNKGQECLTAAARVFEILDTPVEIKSPPNALRVPRACGTIRFDAVTFAYKDCEPILHGINFEVTAGECVAIVGPTAAGKSSLLSLIPRFYDPNFGRVMLDGHDLKKIDLSDLRRNIGLVFQENFLFSNTITANIGFGHPEATARQIEKAARIACAHEFIMKLPEGYETIIGERGCDLSGGQRQRLAIARAVLLEPTILLLDDPTAAIDPETEHEILKAMDNVMKNRTTFVVAHRLSTLRRANRIIVLDKGRIVQSGTHKDLMTTQGHYRKAASLQVADAESKRLLAVGEGVNT